MLYRLFVPSSLTQLNILRAEGLTQVGKKLDTLDAMKLGPSLLLRR